MHPAPLLCGLKPGLAGTNISDRHNGIATVSFGITSLNSNYLDATRYQSKIFLNHGCTGRIGVISSE